MAEPLRWRTDEDDETPKGAPLTREQIAKAAQLIADSGLLLGASVHTAFQAAAIMAGALEDGNG